MKILPLIKQPVLSLIFYEVPIVIKLSLLGTFDKDITMPPEKVNQLHTLYEGC